MILLTYISENALKYMKMLSEINQCVMRMVYDSYGIDTKQCDQFIASMFYLARFIKYRAPSDQDKRAIAIDHPMTEKNFISILGDNNVKGLEIQMRNGEWIYHKPSPSTFVVIAGEPFMVIF